MRSYAKLTCRIQPCSMFISYDFIRYDSDYSPL